MSGRCAVLVGLLVAVAACSSGSSTASGPPSEVRSIPNPDVIVFMDPGATPAQTAAVRRAVRESDALDRYAFTSHASAYREFRKFAVGSDLAAVTRPSDLPESFGLVLRSDAKWRRLVTRLERMPGVQAVKRPTAALRRLCRAAKLSAERPAWVRQRCNGSLATP